MAVASVFLNGHTEHLRGRGAVNIAAIAEHVQHPVLGCYPGNHTRLYGGEVAHVQYVAGRGYKGRAYQLTQYLRDVGVVQLKVLQVAGPHQCAGIADVGQVVLGQVLHLHQPPRPAPRPCGAIELEQAVDASVIADTVQHGLILLIGCLGHLTPQLHDTAGLGAVCQRVVNLAHGLLADTLKVQPRLGM